MAASPFEDVSIAEEGAAGLRVVEEGPVAAVESGVVVDGAVVGPGVVPVVKDVAVLEGGVPAASGVVVEGATVLGPGVVPVIEGIAVLEGVPAESGAVVEGTVAGLRAFEDPAVGDLASTGSSGMVEEGTAVVEGGGEGLGGVTLLLKRATGLIFTVPLEEKDFQQSHRETLKRTKDL